MANSEAPKRIVITRAFGQNENLRAELKNSFGAAARIIELPCVEFREPEDTAALDGAIRTMSDFAWILFTSQNAARYFARRMRALGGNPAQIGKVRPRIAAIGPATAEATSAEGFSVDFVPSPGTGRSFAGSFKDSIRSVAGMEVKNPTAGFLRGIAGMKVLVPRSDLALRDRGATDWTEVLREAGAEVTAVAAYQTCSPKMIGGAQFAEVMRDGADCFVFASPSAFENFAHAAGLDKLKHLAQTSVFAAIGPTTAAAIRAADVACAVESTEPDAKLLAEAILSYLKSMGRRPEGAKAV
ncbi:MAG TPA: uroporphyrinogen-III synthase [Candidatus Acidoferrales bacterium]|nr:uroporphyrinogen-III synthase [Candidatus Acidoferrales bacterium]